MAHSDVAALNSTSHSSRNPPYYVETREYRYSRDELRQKGHNLQPAPSHSSSKATFAPPNQSYPQAIQKSPHHIDKREHSDLRASRLGRRSSEYEDIYNRRFQRGYPGQRRSSGGYGLSYSFREKMNGRAVQIGIRGGWRAPKESSHMRDSRGMIRNNGHQRNMEERGKLENIKNARYSWDTRDVRDVTGIRYFDEAKNKREDMKYPHTSHVDTRYTEEQTRINNTRQNAEETRDNVDNWAEEIKSARQTSFPRNPKQETFDERSIPLRNNVNNNTMYHNVQTTPRSQDPANIEQRSLSESASEPKPKKQPPPVSAKPIRPKPQTTRPASPARSVQSSVSDVSSHATRHSAVSEISVKSILKKPRVAGRVVLKEEPSSFHFLAIASCILCFPFGIYALVKSEQVKCSIEENDYTSALSSSKKVKHFCIGITLAYLGIFFIGGALLAKYFITGELF